MQIVGDNSKLTLCLACSTSSAHCQVADAVLRLGFIMFGFE
jgi:hypothetical protein